MEFFCQSKPLAHTTFFSYGVSSMHVSRFHKTQRIQYRQNSDDYGGFCISGTQIKPAKQYIDPVIFHIENAKLHNKSRPKTACARLSTREKPIEKIRKINQQFRFQSKMPENAILTGKTIKLENIRFLRTEKFSRCEKSEYGNTKSFENSGYFRQNSRRHFRTKSAQGFRSHIDSLFSNREEKLNSRPTTAMLKGENPVYRILFIKKPKNSSRFATPIKNGL